MRMGKQVIAAFSILLPEINIIFYFSLVKHIVDAMFPQSFPLNLDLLLMDQLKRRFSIYVDTETLAWAQNDTQQVIKST